MAMQNKANKPFPAENYCVILAMHGAPPLEFPKEEIMELMGLHFRLHNSGGEEKAALQSRHDALEEKMRRWPRTPENDPFYAASLRMGENLSRELGARVFVGFNEFCAPTIMEAVSSAAALSPEKIIVVTPMMTPGGEHSQRDIPAAIDRARQRFPEIDIRYAWPFPPGDIALFLAAQIRKFKE
jgi:sirohydrochlorin cobaltochelatase